MWVDDASRKKKCTSPVQIISKYSAFWMWAEIERTFSSSVSNWQVDFFFQAEDGIRDYKVTGVQTCALPIWGCGSRLAHPLRPRDGAGRGRLRGDAQAALLPGG